MKNFMERVRGWIMRRQLQRKIRKIRGKVRADQFSVISQNCIGGVLYHDMEMQFLSPTINAFIREPDFVRMVLNLKHYMQQEPVMRWEEEYPVGKLDDIEIHFMHYGTCEEAKDAWERRKKRINYDRILVLATDRDGFDSRVYEQWKQIPYPKVLFTANPEYTEDAVYYPEFSGAVGDLISGREFYRDGIVTAKLNAL